MILYRILTKFPIDFFWQSARRIGCATRLRVFESVGRPAHANPKTGCTAGMRPVALFQRLPRWMPCLRVVAVCGGMSWPFLRRCSFLQSAIRNPQLRALPARCSPWRVVIDPRRPAYPRRPRFGFYQNRKVRRKIILDYFRRLLKIRLRLAKDLRRRRFSIGAYS